MDIQEGNKSQLAIVTLIHPTVVITRRLLLLRVSDFSVTTNTGFCKVVGCCFFGVPLLTPFFSYSASFPRLGYSFRPVLHSPRCCCCCCCCCDDNKVKRARKRGMKQKENPVGCTGEGKSWKGNIREVLTESKTRTILELSWKQHQSEVYHSETI